MKWKWDDTVCVALIVIAAALASWLYPVLPDPVPTHWNLQGEADGFTPKPWGVLGGPLLILGLWVVLRLVPFISPTGFRMESFFSIYRIIVLATVSLLVLSICAALLAAAGYGIGLVGFLTGLLGILFIILGNYMGKVRRNFFVGIRTPWTLASEEVWHRTHRLAGWLFVLAGVVVLAGALAGWGGYVLLPGAVVAALVPVVYSLWLYHRIEGFRPEE
jgi:uncharacterized membrane protein